MKNSIFQNLVLITSVMICWSAGAGELQTAEKPTFLFVAPLPGHPDHQNILYCLQDKCERIGSEAGYTNKEFEWMQDRCEGLSSTWKAYLSQIIFTTVGGALTAWWPTRIIGAFAGSYVADALSPEELPEVYEISATYLNSLNAETRFVLPYEKLNKIEKGVRSCVDMYEIYKRSDPVFRRQMDRGIWMPFG